MPLCQCGCGKEVKEGCCWSKGHHFRGKKRSEETRAKMSLSKKGSNGTMCGKKHSEKARAKMSLVATRRRHSEETKQKISTISGNRSLDTKAKMSKSQRRRYEEHPEIREAISGENSLMFGKHLPEETRKKISLANMEHPVSLETRTKISIANSGENCSEKTRMKRSFALKGRFLSEEHKNKIAIANNGEKSCRWLGGIAQKPYAPGNTKELKDRIRERDNHTCQECGRVWDEGKGKFAPHHINYCKKTHVMWNRITLCHSCHSKTLLNREYWSSHFYEIITNNCIQRILST